MCLVKVRIFAESPWRPRWSLIVVDVGGRRVLRSPLLEVEYKLTGMSSSMSAWDTPGTVEQMSRFWAAIRFWPLQMPLTLAIAGVMGGESKEWSSWKLLSENLDGRRIFRLIINAYLWGWMWGQLASRMVSFRISLLWRMRSWSSGA